MSELRESLHKANAAWNRVDALLGAIHVLVQLAQERLEKDQASGSSISQPSLMRLATDFERLYALAVNVGTICTDISGPARRELQNELLALHAENLPDPQRLLYSAGMVRLSNFQEADRTIGVLAQSAQRDAKLLKDLATNAHLPPDVMVTFDRLIARLKARA